MTIRDPDDSDAGVPPFPAAVGISHLRVYDTVAPDGQRGGSPHVHLASAEAYIVTAGQGIVETLSVSGGVADFDLKPGRIVWFEPGVIHRLINQGDLEIAVVMQNAGLPEAGDAVLAFPVDWLVDPVRYAGVADLSSDDDAERLSLAMRRRDLAVEGFLRLRSAAHSGDLAPLHRFLAAAVALRQHRVDVWCERWRDGPLAETALTDARLDALADGNTSLLEVARVYGMGAVADHPGFGMCGRLDTYLAEGVVSLPVPRSAEERPA